MLPILLLVAGKSTEGGGGGGGGGGGDDPPTAPTTLQVSVLSGTSLRLTWTDNSDNETGFVIDRSTNGGSSWTEDYATVGANVTSYDDEGLTTDQEYTYRVKAVNEFGSSGYTSEVSGTPVESPPGSPDPPTDVAATMQATNTTIRITWTDDSSDEDGFNIYSSVNGGGYSLLTSVGAGVEQYDDTGLTLGNTYAYKVAAFNDGGESIQVGPATVTGLGVIAGAPTGLTATLNGTTQIDLDWDDFDHTPPEGTETGYKVYRNVNGGSYSLLTTSVSSSYSNTGLTQGNLYGYKVTAYNTVSEGSQSGAATEATPLQPPTNLEINIILESPYTVRLTWTDNSTEEGGFAVEYDPGSGFENYANTGANVTQYDIADEGVSGLPFRIRALGSHGGVPISDPSNEYSAP